MPLIHLSHCHSLALCCTVFVPSQNLATFDDGVLHGGTWCRGTRGVTPGRSDGPEGLGLSHVSPFHQRPPPKKPTFQSMWLAALSRRPASECSGNELGSLAIVSLYSTLHPSITCSTLEFHLNSACPLQYSVGDEVVLEKITYVKGCVQSDFPHRRGSFDFLRVYSTGQSSVHLQIAKDKAEDESPKSLKP